MFDLKYRDKGYLTEYDLNVELFERFDLKVYDVFPVRKVFFISTNKGEKILKKVDYTIEEFQFITNAIDYIKRSFNRVIDFLDTKDNEKYTVWNGEVYCIMNLVEGRECEYANPIDLELASKGLGELHKASEGFRYKSGNKYICGKLIENFKRKRGEVAFFKSMANLYENKSEFDNIFLKHVDYYLNKIDESIALLNNTQYLKLCSEEDKIVLCHHDLAHHNIIINEDNAYFVDFDYSVIDLKVHDICNMINKVVKNFDFDIEKANNVINNYCKSNTINKKELEVLLGMLTFPEDLYNISKDYYLRRKEWDEQVFVCKLIKKVSGEKGRAEFLDNFKKEIN